MPSGLIRVYGLSLTPTGNVIARFATLDELKEYAKARGIKQYYITGPYGVPPPNVAEILMGTDKPKSKFEIGDKAIWSGWGEVEIVDVVHNPPYQPDYIVKDKSGHRAFRKKIAHEWDLKMGR